MERHAILQRKGFKAPTSKGQSKVTLIVEKRKCLSSIMFWNDSREGVNAALQLFAFSAGARRFLHFGFGDYRSSVLLAFAVREQINVGRKGENAISPLPRYLEKDTLVLESRHQIIGSRKRNTERTPFRIRPELNCNPLPAPA